MKKGLSSSLYPESEYLTINSFETYMTDLIYFVEEIVKKESSRISIDLIVLNTCAGWFLKQSSSNLNSNIKNSIFNKLYFNNIHFIHPELSPSLNKSIAFPGISSIFQIFFNSIQKVCYFRIIKKLFHHTNYIFNYFDYYRKIIVIILSLF